ncbi:L-aspartate oxidase [bacterium]|nr:L-aspartate oxidase [bacterium]
MPRPLPWVPEDSDFAVIGSGIAGIIFALFASERARVTVFTKKEQSESNTNYAQGGIAAVLDPTDSEAEHVRDTEIAGVGLCRREAVEILVHEGPPLIRQLAQWGVQFSRRPESGGFDLGMEGGHSHRRIVHAHDMTGRQVEEALLAELRRRRNVTILEHCYVVDLEVGETPDGRQCTGLWYYDPGGPCLRFHPARAVLVATGGLGQVYLHTTNPAIATGDGIGMAYRAGATLANMEFVQFHPTAFYTPNGTPFLVSEAVRGEGGILKTLDGAPFMEHYDPRGCLAPRDIVARAIDAEMKKRGDQHVLLDLTHRDADFLRRRFPFISTQCAEHGVDLTRSPIPVVPAAHYSCGGIECDTWGRTDIAGLYAAGEAAHTGVHGANRLASNSLLEALVWGKRAAESCLSERLGVQMPRALAFRPLNQRREGMEAIRWVHMTGELRRLMWDYVGIVRSSERLRFAQRRLAVMQAEVDYLIESGMGIVETFELRNMVAVARLIVESALHRRESRGLHYSLDYLRQDDTQPPVETKVRINPFAFVG